MVIDVADIHFLCSDYFQNADLFTNSLWETCRHDEVVQWWSGLLFIWETDTVIWTWISCHIYLHSVGHLLSMSSFYVQDVFRQLFNWWKSRITFGISWINIAAARSNSRNRSDWWCFPCCCRFQVTNTFLSIWLERDKLIQVHVKL